LGAGLWPQGDAFEAPGTLCLGLLDWQRYGRIAGRVVVIMSTQHTPGPWVVYDDSDDGKTNQMEIAARGKTVARIYHSVPEEDWPNACLIAAAPDLLEALRTARDHIDMDALEISHCKDAERIRAAIAKATEAA